MSILHKLLEYQDPSLQGIPLKNAFPNYNSADNTHHRYHKTKAGLYVVLRHNKDGSIQTKKICRKGSYSYTNPQLDNQNPFFADGFSCKELARVYNPSAEDSSICRSTTSHLSGLKITYDVDGVNCSIRTVNLSNQYFFEEKKVSMWCLSVQQNPPGPVYRSMPVISVKASIFSYVKYEVEPNGKIKTITTSNLEEKILDYESTVSNILELIQRYTPSPNQEDIRKQLGSLDCLVFE